MNNKSLTFLKLNDIFSSHGYRLYLVGGTVRDILLNKELDDMDVVTDATPEEMKHFIEGDFTFAKMGSVKCKVDNVKFDITTLRKEKRYTDSRHPADIKFVKSLKIDHKRRDFTINAMYMDCNFKLIDFENGMNDLNNKTIRMVGNPYKRLKEDPLRILRAIRFMLIYDLKMDERLEKALAKTKKYLNNINIEKIKMEIKKMKGLDRDRIKEIFIKYSIQYSLDVLE